MTKTKLSTDLQSVLSEFETYLLEHSNRPAVMSDRLSNIIGVLIDVKPTAIIDFSPQSERINLADFEKYLSRLGLSFIYDRTIIGSGATPDFIHTYFISKQPSLIRQLLNAEHELYELFQTNAPNAPVIKATHRLIGRLLGYPETAIDYFLLRQEKMELAEIPQSEWSKDIESYFHFIHSQLNGVDEFEVYDRPIHEAMAECLPTSAEIMQKTYPKKRWL